MKILKHGTVTVMPDGHVEVRDFCFDGEQKDSAAEAFEAASLWAIDRLTTQVKAEALAGLASPDALDETIKELMSGVQVLTDAAYMQGVDASEAEGFTGRDSLGNDITTEYINALRAALTRLPAQKPKE